MGAIFFYVFIFFAGYYGSNVLNMLTVRPLVTNRYIAALFPVYGIAMGHAYMIATKPLPPGKDVTIESALLEFVVLPLVVVTMGAVYFMWNNKSAQVEQAANTEREADVEEDTDTVSAQPDHSRAIKSTEAIESIAEKEETKK